MFQQYIEAYVTSMELGTLNNVKANFMSNDYDLLFKCSFSQEK